LKKYGENAAHRYKSFLIVYEGENQFKKIDVSKVNPKTVKIIFIFCFER
jgi:hypothetical protein